MMPEFLHAQIETVYEDDDGYTECHYEVVLMVGSHEVVRLRSDAGTRYRDNDYEREVMAETLKEFFSGNLSPVR